MKQKFNPGKFVVTAGVNEELKNTEGFKGFLDACIEKHLQGHWGTLDDEDKLLNDEALTSEGRLFSNYVSKKFPRLWIITEWDRSYTTILFPSEY